MSLTREQILEMQPGPELNKLIAQHVMGLECYWPAILGANTSIPGTSRLRRLPSYSADISAAYAMEERLKQIGDKKLIEDYLTNLILLAGGNGFEMVHADAEKRAKAALLAVMEV